MNHKLIGTIFGSAEHPVSSALVGSYLQGHLNGLFFGPNNSSMNLNLSRPKTITDISSAAILPQSSDFGGSIDLETTPANTVLGDLNVSHSTSASGYVTSTFADLNNDNIPDLIMANNLGEVSVYYGPIADGSKVDDSQASFKIRGATQI